MLYAVISDIHANASALKKVLADAWKEGATHIVCLGDVVGYGPEPAKSVVMIRREKATIVAGNHDDAVSGRADASNFNDLAADAVSRHRAALRDDEKEWLGALPYIANIEGDAVCVHGDLTAPREFRYIETTDDAAANFKVCANQLIFVGHTHEPCLFITGASGRTYKTKPQDFAVEAGKRYIVNVGTVGYPREENGTCLSSYVLYDSERREVRFRFLPFAVASVMQRGAAPEQRQDQNEPRKSAEPQKSTLPPHPDAATVRERRFVIFAFCAIIAISAATLMFVVASRKSDGARESPPQTVKSVEKATVENPKPAKVFKKTHYVKSGEKHVRANVVLSKPSAPAILTIDFLTQAGAVISTKTIEVKQKNTAKHQIPQNSHRVEFTVAPQNPGDTIKITRFEPTAE